MTVFSTRLFLSMSFWNLKNSLTMLLWNVQKRYFAFLQKRVKNTVFHKNKYRLWKIKIPSFPGKIPPFKIKNTVFDAVTFSIWYTQKLCAKPWALLNVFSTCAWLKIANFDCWVLGCNPNKLHLVYTDALLAKILLCPRKPHLPQLQNAIFYSAALLPFSNF